MLSLKFEEIQSRLQQAKIKSLAAEYFLTEDTIYIFLFSTKRQLLKFRIPRGHLDIPRSLDVELRRSRDIEVLPKEWPNLDGRLIGPLIENAEDCDLIYIVPHGMLYHYPFHAAKYNGQMLIDIAPVIYMPSLMLLPIEDKRYPPQGNALVMGNMTEDLDGAEEEARQVADILEVRPFLGKRATLKQLFQRAYGRRLIHLAGHGFFDPDQPLTSGIPFSDGVLTADRINELQITNAFVVLSGCVTGLGDQRPGEGYASLMGALFRAGAQGTLASLWPVDDETTKQLMVTFYKNKIIGKLPWPYAMREAMRTVRDNLGNRYGKQTPYFWAAFSFYGNCW